MRAVIGGCLRASQTVHQPPPKPMSDMMTAADQPDDEERSPDGDVWRPAGIRFAQFRAGDRSALDDLVRLLNPVLWQVVRAYGLDSTHAEDVVQQTWLTLVRRQAAIRDPQAVSSWVIITARREAWRVANRDNLVTPVEDEVLERRAAVGTSAEAQVLSRDAAQEMWQAVATLGERCRRLLRVIAFDDRPDYHGLAEELAMPIGSIGPTRGRCLAKLRAALNDGDRQ